MALPATGGLAHKGPVGGNGDTTSACKKGRENPMKGFRLTTALLGAVALLAAGCGGDDDSGAATAS